MPQGKGTYGSKVGRPPKKSRDGSKGAARYQKQDNSSNKKWERRVY